MRARAKLFKHGGSQAVRLPKDFRFEGAAEVAVHREGRRVVLEPVRGAWSRRFLALAGSVPDFPDVPEPARAEDGPSFE